MIDRQTSSFRFLYSLIGTESVNKIDQNYPPTPPPLKFLTSPNSYYQWTADTHIIIHRLLTISIIKEVNHIIIK